MKIRHLLWFLCVLFAFKALLFSVITYAPGGEWLGRAIPLVFGSFSIALYMGAEKAGQLPDSHWINQSRPIQIGIMVVLSLFAFLLLLAG